MKAKARVIPEHGICGVTTISPGGKEWICVKKVHAKIYQTRSGKKVFSSNPQGDFHFFAPRWPNQP